MTNKITTFLGVITIVAALTSVFILDKVNWWDVLGGGVLGITLIYTKNSTAPDKIIELMKIKTNK